MSNATWMSDVASKVGGRKLNKVALPGTHDSGTYGISSDSDSSPDNPNNAKDIIKHLEGIPYLGNKLKGIFAGWAKAQGKNIIDQSDAGIRYLDLLVCRRSGSDMYIVHGMYAEKVNVVIDAVHTFVTNNDVLLNRKSGGVVVMHKDDNENKYQEKITLNNWKQLRKRYK